MFGFESGVLSITGDSGLNVIGPFQPRDGVMQVMGDGARRTFQGVNEVVLDARIKNTGGNGNQAGTSGKTETRYILFEFSNVHGGDSIWIDIQYPARTSLDATINLGDGNDSIRYRMFSIVDRTQLDVDPAR